jgi:hypothetical protein
LQILAGRYITYALCNAIATVRFLQADGFWKMLDDLHASDPSAYDTYIKDMMDKAKAEEVSRDCSFHIVLDLSHNDTKEILDLTLNRLCS